MLADEEREIHRREKQGKMIKKDAPTIDATEHGERNFFSPILVHFLRITVLSENPICRGEREIKK